MTVWHVQVGLDGEGHILAVVAGTADAALTQLRADWRAREKGRISAYETADGTDVYIRWVNVGIFELGAITPASPRWTSY